MRITEINVGLTCRRTVRRGFTLAELVVALGVLVLMFSLAGQVFNTTIKSTGQAKALTETTQLLRAFQQTLRDDLRAVEPGHSLILIQGNPVNAYWTQEGREADDDGDPSTGYPHAPDPNREDANGRLVPPRADILMLFTARKGTSTVAPEITANLQQVVYGHADLGEYLPAPTGGGVYDFAAGPTAFPVDTNTGYPSATEVSPVPAARWHLARRNVLLVPTDMATGMPPGQALIPDNKWIAAVPKIVTVDKPAQGFGDDRYLQAKFDVLGLFAYEDFVLTPGASGPWFLPSAMPDIFDTRNVRNPIRRSQLDVTPPAPLANRLAHYFLPNCASFKVEWALDPRSAFVDGRLDGTTEVYWLDPGKFDPADSTVNPLATLIQARDAADPRSTRRANLQGLLDEPTYAQDANATLTARFNDPLGPWVQRTDGRSNVVVFGASHRDAGPDGIPGNADDVIIPDEVFPGALRITVELYDRERRLDRPMRYVMVVPIGS